MNEKNNNIWVSLIAIALLISIVFGAVALFKRIDETISDIDKGTTSTDKDNSSDTENEDTNDNTDNETEGDEEPEENPDFYLDPLTNTGYSTVGNKTYFFIRIAKENIKPCFHLDIDEWSAFANYSKVCNFSKDAKTWTSNYSDNLDEQYIYVSYTTINNCTNRAYVLEDLKQNVFFDKTYFNYTFDEHNYQFYRFSSVSYEETYFKCSKCDDIYMIYCEHNFEYSTDISDGSLYECTECGGTKVIVS